MIVVSIVMCAAVWVVAVMEMPMVAVVETVLVAKAVVPMMRACIKRT